MQYYIKIKTTIDDFAKIERFTEELTKAVGQEKGMTFRQAKRSLIKLYVNRINAIKKLTEKEYNANNSRTS